MTKLIRELICDKMEKVAISSMASTGEPEYSHLLPIVEALKAMGNAVKGSGFYMEKDGWRCEFVEPLDFENLEELFVFPSTIRVLPDFDAIHCTKSWAIIEGGLAPKVELESHDRD